MADSLALRHNHRTGGIGLLLSAGVCALGCALPADSTAAVVDGGIPYEKIHASPEHGGDTGPEPRELTFTAEPGERNSLRVSQNRETVVFRDRGAARLRATGFGCREVSRQSVHCRSTLEPGPYFTVPLNIRTHSGDDRVVVSWTAGHFLYTTLWAGAGRDRVRIAGDTMLFGGSGNDRLVVRSFQSSSIYGGPGRDHIVLRGNSGGDSVSGGPGTDRVDRGL